MALIISFLSYITLKTWPYNPPPKANVWHRTCHNVHHLYTPHTHLGMSHGTCLTSTSYLPGQSLLHCFILLPFHMDQWSCWTLIWTRTNWMVECSFRWPQWSQSYSLGSAFKGRSRLLALPPKHPAAEISLQSPSFMKYAVLHDPCDTKAQDSQSPYTSKSANGRSKTPVWFYVFQQVSVRSLESHYVSCSERMRSGTYRLWWGIYPKHCFICFICVVAGIDNLISLHGSHLRWAVYFTDLS